MKKFLFALLLLMVCVAAAVSAQPQSPVAWSASAVKTDDGNYKLIITASIPAPWHIYAQTTPEGGPVPTSFTFIKNPLVTLVGKTAEKGNLKTMHDKNFGVDVKSYAEKVQFIQTVKVKNGAKTNVGGSVNYMVCNDSECMPPSSWDFSVQLN